MVLDVNYYRVSLGSDAFDGHLCRLPQGFTSGRDFDALLWPKIAVYHGTQVDGQSFRIFGAQTIEHFPTIPPSPRLNYSKWISMSAAIAALFVARRQAYIESPKTPFIVVPDSFVEVKLVCCSSLYTLNPPS